MIRSAEAAELDHVVDLLLLANDEHLRSFPPAVAEGYRHELEGVSGTRSGAEVFVLAADRLLGTVTFLPDASADGHTWPAGGAVLRFLAVAPNAQQRGRGKQLVSFCVQRARDRGASYLGLHTAPVMRSARRLYEGMGFVRAEELDFAPDHHYGREGSGQEPRWGLAYVLHFAGGGDLT